MSKDIFSGRERRKYVRINTAVPVRFKISEIDSEKVYSATTKNISHGGLCLDVSQDKNELVETLSSLPQEPTIEIAPLLPDWPDTYTAEAAWITSTLDWAKRPCANEPSLLMGMNFVEMADSLRRQIYDFIVSEFLHNYEMADV
jgi:c-di-GMP-binding flagellar brake protein YcgR